MRKFLDVYVTTDTRDDREAEHLRCALAETAAIPEVKTTYALDGRIEVKITDVVYRLNHAAGVLDTTDCYVQGVVLCEDGRMSDAAGDIESTGDWESVGIVEWENGDPLPWRG